VIGEILGTGDHPRGKGGRQPEALLLVELRVLEGAQTLDLVQVRGGQPGLLDEEPLGQHERTTFGSGPVRRAVGGRLDGDRSQGAASSPSLIVSVHRTPTTWPVRLASRAIRSTVIGSSRGTEVRNAHRSGSGRSWSSRKTGIALIFVERLSD
jgi:hypothetical protein